MFLDDLKIGFQSVSGLVLKKEKYDPFHESGENFELAVHRGSKTELNRLTLTKGVGAFNPSKLMSKINVMLMLVYDSAGIPVRGYAFSAGYVESVSVSDFNAEQSRVLIDTTVILYDWAVEVDLIGASSAELYAIMSAQKAFEKSRISLISGVNAAKIAAHNAAVKEKKQKQLDEKKRRKLIEY